MVLKTGIEAEAKTWTEPQLTILVRNNPEEAILGVCKTFSLHNGPDNDYSLCLARGDTECFAACAIQHGS